MGKLIGSETPRLWTPEARDLTCETTTGYELIDFAERVLGEPLLPWQRWLAIHMLELSRGGGHRYRTVVVLVARQNGKTHFLRILALWSLYVGGARLVLSTAQSLDIAREAWRTGCSTVQSTPDLNRELVRIARVNGDEHLELTGDRRWKISASNDRAGRGLSVDLVILDELRHLSSDAWAALSKTTMARPNALILGISNAGDDDSETLNHLREVALSERDPSVGLFEWSAPDGCALDDPQAWAQANPGLGHTISEQAIRSALSTDPAPIFRTEILCQHVDTLADAAVTKGAWDACADPALTLDDLRRQIVVFVDVAPDNAHATLVAAAINPTDDRARLEAIASWTDTPTMLAELPGWLDRIKPKAKGYFKTGPAAGLATDLDKLGFTPATSADQIGACQALVEHITGRRLLHAGDPLLTAHIVGAKKLISGDGYRFARRGAGHVDAAYAAAGAIHLARLLPPPAQHRVRWIG